MVVRSRKIFINTTPPNGIINSGINAASGSSVLIGRMASFSGEDLIALDYLAWMGSGVKAAKAMECDQSTISRKSLDNCKFFGIKLQKEKGEGIYLVTAN
jgi:hypothetical protein